MVLELVARLVCQCTVHAAKYPFMYIIVSFVAHDLLLEAKTLMLEKYTKAFESFTVMGKDCVNSEKCGNVFNYHTHDYHLLLL